MQEENYCLCNTAVMLFGHGSTWGHEAPPKPGARPNFRAGVAGAEKLLYNKNISLSSFYEEMFW
jgi:hypothetical protein